MKSYEIYDLYGFVPKAPIDYSDFIFQTARMFSCVGSKRQAVALPTGSLSFSAFPGRAQLFWWALVVHPFSCPTMPKPQKNFQDLTSNLENNYNMLQSVFTMRSSQIPSDISRNLVR